MGFEPGGDGSLDAILPFEWTRLYRTSAVEVDCGLGFGWSHSLAHRLQVTGDSVVWADHENRPIALPLPSASRPAITNSLAEAAIYLGEKPDEWVLAQASRFYHFVNGSLTAIGCVFPVTFWAVLSGWITAWVARCFCATRLIASLRWITRFSGPRVMSPTFG